MTYVLENPYDVTVWRSLQVSAKRQRDRHSDTRWDLLESYLSVNAGANKNLLPILSRVVELEVDDEGISVLEKPRKAFSLREKAAIILLVVGIAVCIQFFLTAVLYDNKFFVPGIFMLSAMLAFSQYMRMSKCWRLPRLF